MGPSFPFHPRHNTELGAGYGDIQVERVGGGAPAPHVQNALGHSDDVGTSFIQQEDAATGVGGLTDAEVLTQGVLAHVIGDLTR